MDKKILWDPQKLNKYFVHIDLTEGVKVEENWQTNTIEQIPTDYYIWNLLVSCHPYTQYSNIRKNYVMLFLLSWIHKEFIKSFSFSYFLSKYRFDHCNVKVINDLWI